MQQNSKIISRLTALWAISESGLGGFMHAMKIPFTGFFLGAFAIVIITVIATYSDKKWRTILQATIIVMLVKMIASPHSPPTAYLAVAFQGLLGAGIYAIFKLNKLSSTLFGLIALAESALQKLIVMTLIFGKNLWEALDAFFHMIVKEFHITTQISFSTLLIAFYISIYMLWGALVGRWAAGVPEKLQERAAMILTQLPTIPVSDNSPVPKRKKGKTYFVYILILSFILATFLFQEHFDKMVYSVLRAVAALLMFYTLVNPILTWLIKRWLQQQKDQNKKQLGDVLDLLPEIKSHLKPAMQLARANYKGVSRYPAFVINWIVLSLYSKS